MTRNSPSRLECLFEGCGGVFWLSNDTILARDNKVLMSQLIVIQDMALETYCKYHSNDNAIMKILSRSGILFNSSSNPFQRRYVWKVRTASEYKSDPH